LSCGWYTTTCVPFRSTTLGQEGVALTGMAVTNGASCAEQGIKPVVRHAAIVTTSRLLDLTMCSSRMIAFCVPLSRRALSKLMDVETHSIPMLGFSLVKSSRGIPLRFDDL
jgi:hypothetical protein